MKKITFLVLGLMAFASSLHAQEWNQLGSTFQYESKAMNAIAMNGSGSIVATSPSYTVSSGIMTGEVQIFQYDGAAWVQLGQDIAYGGVATSSPYGDSAELSLSLSDDGHTLAIGAPYTNSGAGKAGIFHFNGTDWVQVGDDIPGIASANFGSTVALTADGTKVVIAADLENAATNFEGMVQVYQLNGATWEQFGQTIYPATNEGTRFGYDVDINDAGDMVVATFYDGGGVKIYQLDGTVWLETANLNDTPSGYVSFNATGSRLAIGSYTASSATGTMFAGKVSVYEKNGTAWEQVGSSLYGSAMFQMFSRVRLNAEGNILAVGSEGLSSQYGRADVFQIVNGDWYQTGALVDNVTGTFYGSSVALNNAGDIVTIGSREGAGSATAHYARAFQFNCTVAAPVAEETEAVCGGNAVTLSVTPTEEITYNWYDSADATEPVFTGTSFETPALTETTNYWVEAVTILSCTSEKTEVTATVNPLPEAPVAESEQLFAAGATLTALEVEAAGELTWYADEELTTVVEDTIELVNNITYYVTQTVNGCASAATAIVALDEVLSTGNINADAFTHFPNPVKDRLYFSGAVHVQSVQLYDISGRMVLSQSAQEINETDLTRFAAGTYIVKAQTENGVKSFKVVKQ